MNYLKASDMSNDEKAKKATKAFFKLEAVLNKKNYQNKKNNQNKMMKS